MNVLKPYEGQRGGPLTAGARFVRGFRRIGFAVATILVLWGLVWAVAQGNASYRVVSNRFDEAACVAKAFRDSRLDLGKLSDSELEALYRKTDVSRMSDDELNADEFAIGQSACAHGYGFSHSDRIVDRAAINAALVAVKNDPPSVLNWIVPFSFVLGWQSSSFLAAQQ
jgi:hypothetical protein